MSKDYQEIRPRMEIIEELMMRVRDALLAVDTKYTVSELVSALLTITAHAAEVMLAMSSADTYAANLRQVLNGIKQLEDRVNPPAKES